MNHLRLCAGCNRSFLAYASSTAFYCNECGKRRAATRPAVVKGSIVRHFDGPDAYKRYTVITADGDDLTVRQLGFPESLTFAARLGEMVAEQ